MSQVVSNFPRVAPPRLIRGEPMRATAMGRLVSGAIFAATMGVLLTAYLLHPSEAGLGTHQQLGLPACGFEVSTALPCATCGMTTAFSHAAHGQFLAAVLAQPAGAALALATAAAALISGYALAFGVSLAPLGRRLWRPAVVWAFAALIVTGWLYKIIITLF